MESRISIKTPNILHIKTDEGISYGFSQNWYRSFIKRMSGCGPTACANLLFYAAETRPEYRTLYPYDSLKRADILEFMQDVWNHVTPGIRGLDKPNMFEKGVETYAAEKGLKLLCDTIDLDGSAISAEGSHAIPERLFQMLRNDHPIAFLNLDNARVPGLQNWHWVTIISADWRLKEVEIYDEGIRKYIDLASWLGRSKAGGFISLS